MLLGPSIVPEALSRVSRVAIEEVSCSEAGVSIPQIVILTCVPVAMSNEPVCTDRSRLALLHETEEIEVAGGETTDPRRFSAVHPVFGKTRRTDPPTGRRPVGVKLMFNAVSMPGDE